MIDELYIAIAAKLQAADVDIATIDLYNQQFDGNNDLPSLPAILLEFGDIQWADHANGKQKGECLLRLHVGQECYAPSDYNNGGGTPTSSAVAVLQFVRSLSLVLHNFVPVLVSGYASPFRRTATTQDNDHDHLHHHIIEYTTTLIDDMTTPDNTRETVNITHTVTANNVPPPPEPPPNPYQIP